MKTIYCIEQCWKSNDVYFRDGSFFEIKDPWKMGYDNIVTHEFDNEEYFKDEILKIINGGGIINKVYIKEMPDDYKPALHL